MIGFLNPLALLGLLAAAIPLLIHFLSRFRAGRREFSSLLLLRQVQDRNTRRLRTRQWLLLALRTLIVLLLVLAPARPVLRGWLASGPGDHLPTAVVVVFDRSASTGYVDERGAVHPLLLRRLEELLGWLGPGDRLRLIAAADNWEEPLGEQWLTPAALDRSRLALLLAPTFRATRLAPALERAARLLESPPAGMTAREVYLLTDRQRGFLGADSLALPPGMESLRWYLLEGQAASPENLAVEELSLAGELVRPGAPLKVTVRLAHHGGSAARQLFPRLYLDGRLAGQGELVLAPDSRGATVIELAPVESGLHELSAVLDADGLAADNSRALALRVPRRAKVVLVEPRPHHPDYLGTALEVLASGRSPLVELERRSLLPLSPAELQGRELIILHGLEFPGSSLRDFLETAWVRRRLPLLVLPDAAGGDRPEVARAFGATAARYGLPFDLEPRVSLSDQQFVRPARPGGAAPAGAAFAGLFEALPGLERLRISAWRRLPPAAEGSGAVARGGGAAPAAVYDLPAEGGEVLLRLVRQEGAAAALATVDLASPAESELPSTPLFLPLVQGLIALLTEDSPLGPGAVTVGEPVELQFGGGLASGQLELHGPDGQKFLLPPGGLQGYAFDRTDRPGLYRLFAGNLPLGGFAVTIDPAESALEPERPERLTAMLGPGLVRVPADREAASLVFAGRGGVEIWSWLLLAALVLLAVEQAVAGRRDKKPADAGLTTKA